MNPIFSDCPVCGDEMIVSKLHCRNCETTIEGRFIASPFAQLTPEQLAFVELFIRNEGKLNRLEDELNLSYPTIRNRLHDVIRALGYEPGEEISGLSEEERTAILDDLNEGKIDYEEAMRLLQENELAT
ncbi:MAG: DUF2089 domain-containing protein [Chloroflexi bacterium]|nr:MAG: DUF2089 domain-containing protein [Chloroflexota bacterium]MBL1193497.1 DUF2089 domain-containing protein [Chloroflexota bacterium]NOH10787.1 DUF2089 domain-containing protein [Chloroflexota bacterium]